MRKETIMPEEKKSDAIHSSIKRSKKRKKPDHDFDLKNLREPERKVHQPCIYPYGPNMEHRYDYMGVVQNLLPRKLRAGIMTEAFLNNCRQKQIELEFVMMDSTRERGRIIGFDPVALTVSNEMHSQFLIYNHSIAKIIPLKNGYCVSIDEMGPVARYGIIRSESSESRYIDIGSFSDL